MVKPRPEAARAPSPASAVFVAGAVLGALGVAPGVGPRDAGELGAAAHLLGVPHPTGFPIDMLLLRAGELLPIGTVALRQALVVALLSAGVLALVAHIAHRLAIEAGAPPGAAAAGGVVAAVGLGSFATFLGTALSVEVYSTALLLVAIAAGAAVEARPGGRLSGSAAVPVVLFLLGLSLGAHVSARLLLAPLAIAVAVARPRGRRLRALGAALPLLLVGALSVLYLPLASLRDPPVDWGDPETVGRAIEQLTAARIRAAYADEMLAFGTTPAAELGAQLAELWPLFLPAAAGAVFLARRAPRIALVAALFLIVDLAYALFANPMGVIDRQVGHAAGAVMAVLAAVGVGSLLGLLWQPAARRWIALGAAAALASFVALRAPGEILASPHGIDELLGSGGAAAAVPPRAVIVCRTDDFCAATLFALHAEDVRPDVAVVPAQHLWEPSVRSLLRDIPRIEALGQARPSSPRARGELAARAVRALLDPEGPRPVVFEGVEAARAAGLVGGLPASIAPPYSALPGTPAATSAAAALDRIEIMRRARLGRGRPGAPRVRTLWSRAFELVARSALDTGDVASAVRGLSGAVELAPERAVAWTNLGVARARAGDVPAAITATARAIELEPARPTAWVNLARYTADSGDRAGARRVLEEAARAGVRDPRLDRLRAELR